MRRQLHPVFSPVDLEPTQGLVEIGAAAEDMLHSGGDPDLVQLALSQKDDPQAIEVAAREGQGEGCLRPGLGVVGFLLAQRLRLAGHVHSFTLGLLALLGSPPSGNPGHAPQGHPEGDEQGAEHDRVREALGGAARGAVGVQAGEAAEKGIPAIPYGDRKSVV